VTNTVPDLRPRSSRFSFLAMSSARRIGLVLLGLVLGFYMAGVRLLDNIELQTFDLRMRSHPATVDHDTVVIAAIDETSLADLGRWPWSRATMARIVERLDALGARVIALDVFFSEAENRALLEQIEQLEREHGYRGTASPYAFVKRALAADAPLAQAIAKSGKVVLPMVFLRPEDEARDTHAADARQALASVENQAVKLIRDQGDGRMDFPMPEVTGLITNLPELTRAARATGHINSIPDRDGTVRWSQLVLRHKGLFFPSADLQAARLYLGEPALMLHTASYGITAVQLGARLFPTDEYGRALIHYRGPARSFPTYSVSDILAGRIDAELLHDKIVLVGATAQGLGDVRVTPYSVFPGVEIRANTIQNLLDNDFIRRPGWMFVFDVLLMLTLGGLLVFLLPRLGLRLSSVLTAALAIGYLLLAVVEFNVQHIWINVAYPALLVLLMFISSMLVHYFTAEREKRQIKHAFQHYVPAAVVDQAIRTIDSLGLGGDKRELTVLFSDIRGFTGIAESLPPEKLVQLLNEYLTRMTDQVFRHEGLLDKYIGDAIMAVYGAPLPQPDHARRACHTAVDMLRALRALQADWRDKGLPALDLGIGINTGPMVVGNMGSQNRFDYTVIGDAVNLGARIESLNKQYGTHILLSEFTYSQVKDAFPHLREIDVTTVRGRNEPVRIYELMLAEHYPHMDWLEEFVRAYELFRANRHAQARPLFQKLADTVNDPVSRYYVERCRAPRRRKGE
jgi:adenylate cyclase